MKLVLSGDNGKVTVKLIDRDVKLSKKIIRRFLQGVKEKSEEKKAPSFFYTFLVVAHVIINDYIKSASPEAIALILEAAYADNERSKNTNN